MAFAGDVKKLGAFYQSMKDVGLRLSYQFQIHIDEIDDQLGDIESISFFAQSATVPGVTEEEAETAYHGVTFRIPNNLVFNSPWVISVRSDSAMVIHDACLNWKKLHADLEKGGGGDKRIPTAKARVDLLSHDLSQIDKSYVLEGVYPGEIGEITLDHADNAIAVFDLSLAYQYWYPSDNENGQGDDPLAKNV